MNQKQLSNRLAKQLGKVRIRKVENLKKRISSGQYQIKNQALARSLFVAR